MHHVQIQGRSQISNDYSQVCKQGFCTGSLCLKVGTPENGTSPGVWEECFVTLPGDLTVQQKEQLCYLACKKNDSDAVCYATNQNLDSSNALYVLLQDVNQRKQSSGGIKLTAGSPCNNTKVTVMCFLVAVALIMKDHYSD
ncbi:uncharacterized protein [Magallana gigas]|uniref:uncharacterized protein n=1 Tax=Magallana gigas TaxID=29159 RepID=UPI00333FE9D8